MTDFCHEPVPPQKQAAPPSLQGFSDDEEEKDEYLQLAQSCKDKLLQMKVPLKP